MIEEWKDVIDFPNYQVSNLGRIKSLPHIAKGGYRSETQRINGKILKPTPNEKGYLRVFLRKNSKTYTRYAHILVAQAFIPNPENKPEVNHKNRN